MIRILVTGDRDWTNGDVVRLALHRIMEHYAFYDITPQELILVEGECRGLDLLAKHIVTLLEWQVDPRPANWKEYGRRAGPIRNQEMLVPRPDVCIAFHDNIAQSKGTKDMINKAVKAGVTTYLYKSDFSCTPICSRL